MPPSPTGPSSIFKDSLEHPLLMATLDAAIDGIVVTCSNAVIRLFSRGAERMFGYTSDEMLGKSINVLMPQSEANRHDSYIQRYLATGEQRVIGKGRRIQAVNKQGEVFPVHMSLGEFEENGERMFVGIARDMRDLSDLESELGEERQKSRRLQLGLHRVYQSSVLSELVASIAHEVNQPLAAIATYADVSRRLLRHKEVEFNLVDGNLEKITDQALRVADVIQKMRDLAPGLGRVNETAEVSEIILGLMDFIYAEARDADCEVRVTLENELPVVRADSIQIQHVILLLLRNSLESFADDSGRDLGIIISGRNYSGDYVQLAVTDHGSGIDSARLDTLYHPFTSNKTDKMGIGLSICSTIIGNHGGRIWHEPNPLGGSRFIFTLPVHATQRQ